MAFCDRKDLVDGGDRDFLVGAIGPEDLELVDFGSGAQAEMESGIRARGIAAAGKDIRSLADAAGGEDDLGADGVARRLEAGYLRRRSCNQS